MPFDKEGKYYKLDHGERFYGSNVHMIRIYALEEIFGEYLNIDLGKIPNNSLKKKIDKLIKEREIVRWNLNSISPVNSLTNIHLLDQKAWELLSKPLKCEVSTLINSLHTLININLIFCIIKLILLFNVHGLDK